MDVIHKRNFILLGHAQSGKTMLAESLLFHCHATTRKGKIEDGTTVSDYSFDEIERKNSINMSVLLCEYQQTRMQIIDTPGYADFINEVLCALRAVDSGIIVIDAAAGVQVGTEKAWELLNEIGIPCMFFISKTDKEGVDTAKILESLKKTFSKNCVFIQSLEDPDLMEAIAESDDTLLEKYLETIKLSQDEIKSGLKQAVLKRKLFPVFCGSAMSEKGLDEFLDAILRYLPNPSERGALSLIDPSGGSKCKPIVLTDKGDFSALVFKNIFDPFVGQLTLMRIFSGSIASNSTFYNVSRKIRERIGQIYILEGKEQRAIEAGTCGDIIAIAKLKETGVSDTLGTEKETCIFPVLEFPEPAISASVKPKSREDEEKISDALHKLVLEDHTFKVNHDPQTKEMIISGLGDLHLAVMVGRLKKRFNVSVELGTPKVSYKETITRSAKVQGKFKRQSGGRGQYGDVWIELQPLERGKGFEFIDKIFGGAIPRNYIPSVEKGVRQACHEGAVAGYPIEDVRVVLVDGSYHDVDSSDMAFQIAGAMALRKAMMECGPILLEPIMEIIVTIPEEYLGAISGDLNSRRGRIMGMEAKEKVQVVKAHAPLSEMFKYANDLRSITGGRGGYTMRFSHYEEVPHKIASGIMSQYQATKKHEE